MALPRNEVSAGLIDELGRFSHLVRTFDETEWAAPTRCAGWNVGDVAAHVVGTMADIAAGKLEGLGTPEVTEREVDERRGRTPGELADELDAAAKVGNDILATFDDDAWNGPAPAGLAGTLGYGVEALWYDAFLHADDMRAAAGRPTEIGPGLRAAVSHVADSLTLAGHAPATVAVDGIEEMPVSGGGGQRITGDPFTFVLVGTGRQDPAVLGLDETINIYR